jgi:hypothetical protein
MGLGPSLPLVELARRDSVFFVEMKCLFFTTPETEIFSKSKEKEVREKRRQKEATGVTGRWTGRGLDMTGASGQCQQLCVARGARVCNRRVQSLTEPKHPVTHLGNNACLRADRTRWRTRSRAIGRVRSTKSLSGTSLDNDRTLALSRPVVAWSASGQTVKRVQSIS